MTITDEMVEAAAREGCGFMAVPDGALTGGGKVYFAGFDLRAALEAVAPMIRTAVLEEAAKVADALAAVMTMQVDAMNGATQESSDPGMISGPSFSETWCAAKMDGARDVAAAIRALEPKP